MLQIIEANVARGGSRVEARGAGVGMWIYPSFCCCSQHFPQLTQTWWKLQSCFSHAPAMGCSYPGCQALQGISEARSKFPLSALGSCHSCVTHWPRVGTGRRSLPNTVLGWSSHMRTPRIAPALLKPGAMGSDCLRSLALLGTMTAAGAEVLLSAPPPGQWRTPQNRGCSSTRRKNLLLLLTPAKPSNLNSCSPQPLSGVALGLSPPLSQPRRGVVVSRFLSLYTSFPHFRSGPVPHQSKTCIRALLSSPDGQRGRETTSLFTTS